MPCRSLGSKGSAHTKLPHTLTAATLSPGDGGTTRRVLGVLLAKHRLLLQEREPAAYVEQTSLVLGRVPAKGSSGGHDGNHNAMAPTHRPCRPGCLSWNIFAAR